MILLSEKKSRSAEKDKDEIERDCRDQRVALGDATQRDRERQRRGKHADFAEIAVQKLVCALRIARHALIQPDAERSTEQGVCERVKQQQ